MLIWLEDDDDDDNDNGNDNDNKSQLGSSDLSESSFRHALD